MSVSPDTAAVHDQVLQAGFTTRTDQLIKASISSMLFHRHTYSNYTETTETPRGAIKTDKPRQILFAKQGQVNITSTRRHTRLQSIPNNNKLRHNV